MKTKSGFTLVETLMGLAIFGLLLTMGVLQTRGAATGGSAGPRALAHNLMAELRAAREKAVQDKSPVAVVFPSAGGNSAHTQSYYILQGVPNPKILKSYNLGGECPGSYFFIGQWPLASGAPSLDSPRGIPMGAFGLEYWFNPPTKDYVLAFDSEGYLITNDLPWYDGKVHIVTCTGLEYSASAPPAGTAKAGASQCNSYALSHVYQPYTVTIDPAGTLALEPGLPGASTAVAIERGGAAPPSQPAAAPPLTTGVNQNPTIEGLEVLPVNTGNDTTVNTTVSINGYATLTVWAKDVDNDNLSCRWQCNNGTFSHPPEGSRMQWDSPNGVWKSTWIWTPPANAGDKSIYNMTCTVFDDLGASASIAASSAIRLQVRSAGKVVFSATDSGSSQTEIYTSNPDGTGARKLTQDTVADNDPSLSPDGTKILWSRAGCLYSMNADGSGRKQLTAPPVGDLDRYPTWAPQGTRFAFTRLDPVLGTTICVQNIDGTGYHTIGPGSNPVWNPQDGPAGETLVYQSGPNLYFCSPTFNGGTPVLIGAGSSPVWRPDSPNLEFVQAGNLVSTNSTPNGSPPYFNTPVTKNVVPAGLATALRFSNAPITAGNPEVVFATSAGIFRAYDPGPNAALTSPTLLSPYGCRSGAYGTPSWTP